MVSFYFGKKVLVTGGCGMIGSHIVEELLRHKAAVRITQHLRPNPFGQEVEAVSADLRSIADCQKAVDGVHFVFHAAGVTGGLQRAAFDPIPVFTDNLLINTQVLEASRQAGVQRFALLSNSSVYAASTESLKEEDAWGDTMRGIAENPAGTVKRMAELQCKIYADSTDLKIGIVRGGNAYGPRDYFDLERSHVLPALVRRAVARQKPFVLWGSGETVRDFTHARDIALGAMFVLEHYAVCDPVNVATGRITSIKDVASIILREAGHADTKVILDSSHPTGPSAKRLDISKMQRLGFAPKIGLEAGLRETIHWFKESFHGDVPNM
jgi:GDP-L-fucose synthase